MSNDKKVDLRTYLVEFGNGTKQRITVPAAWKVTFGPIAVGRGSSANTHGGPRMPLGLRFYEHDTQQRAIFTDVVNFRDMSIPVQVEKIRRQDKVGRMEVDGAVRNVNVCAEVREWVNADETEKQDLPKLLAAADVDLVDFE